MRICGRPVPQERAEVLVPGRSDRRGAALPRPSHRPREPAGRRGRTGPETCGRIDGALARRPADRADDRVRSYSQGMRQRLGVARCLLADPELLILDEPMNGLDPGGILEFRPMIGELSGEGRTVFLSSHLLDEVEKTCDAAAVIDRGRLVAQGPIARSSPARAESTSAVTTAAALDLLDGHPACGGPPDQRPGSADAAARRRRRLVNARLVGGRGLVSRLEPVRESLEQRFLEITSRVGGRHEFTVARQMIGAEILKLRRNRGVMALALLLTVGVIVLMFGCRDPARVERPPERAGRRLGASPGVRVLGVFFGMLAAVLIGVEAGTADLSSGVFRDLVATGRSRLALFLVRVPAAVIVTFAVNLTAFAVALVLSFALSGGPPRRGLA